VKRSVVRWEVGGVFLIFFAGSLLHFAYEWSGRSPAVAIFAAVNESVWEHLKLAFWPSVLYACVEFPFLRRQSGSFVFGKAAGIWTMPVMIAGLFYGYTGVLGHHVLWVDILIFFVGIAAGQGVSCVILRSTRERKSLNAIGLVMLLALAGALVVFTFAPPEVAPFRDPVNGSYGVP